MAYSLTIAGYTFDNPPNKYRKHLTLGNSPVPHFERGLAQFYQSDQQEIQFEVEGQLSLNEQSDLDELERLQQLAINGGEVTVEFDPFFSGKCIIEDDPFRQADELGRYRFIMTVNSLSTDTTAYPSHATPTTGNTFKLGSFDFGYDPDSVEENYERQTNTVDRLQGISQSVDTAGLVAKVTIDGNTDGAGAAALWDKARTNELSYLEAEFQNGWALIADLSVENNENAPHYLKGLFQYSLDLLIVSAPSGGIGQVTSFIDHDVKDTGTYVSDDDSGDSAFTDLEFTVNDGTGSINGDYVAWFDTTLTLTDDATNYVYVDDSDGDGQGTVKFNNSGFPADGLELYRVTTSNGSIIRVEDIRAQLINDNDSDAGDSDSSSDGADLYYTVAGGTSPDDPNNQETTWIQTTLKLALNATNYIFVEDPDSDGTGTVAINQSWYPSNTVSLWRVETDGDSITNEIDDRPDDLTTDGSGDTSDSDLIFAESLTIDDSGFSALRQLVLSDTIPLTPTVAWLGLATFADSFDVGDATLDWTGLVTFTEPLDVDDGGSASTTSEPTLSATATITSGSATVTVYEDTTGDGNADNQQTVTLSDGTTNHTLNQLEGGSGNDYWLDISLTTSSADGTSEVDSLTLDTAPPKTDTDQNPNTQWTVSPGKYDTSGNQYEGGGVTVTYE